MALLPTPADHLASRMPRAKTEKVKGSFGPKEANVIGGTSVAGNALSTLRGHACVEVSS